MRNTSLIIAVLVLGMTALVIANLAQKPTATSRATVSVVYNHGFGTVENIEPVTPIVKFENR